jgi:hypothetical protein
VGQFIFNVDFTKKLTVNFNLTHEGAMLN